MPVFTVHAAKTNLSKLIERAEAGEEIIVARADDPVVRLVPVNRVVERRFGLFRGLAKIGPDFFEALPEEELQGWEGQGDGAG